MFDATVIVEVISRESGNITNVKVRGFVFEFVLAQIDDCFLK